MNPTDPAVDAEAYRRGLLDALGDDDPGAVQAATAARLRELVAAAGDDLRTRPEPREWSVIECIGHIVDAEVVLAARYRWVLSHDEPEIAGYDQDLWVDRLGHRDADAGELLGLFDALRASNLALWRRSTPAERARIGIHNERGPESFELMFRMLAGHDRVHAAQADRALAAVCTGRAQVRSASRAISPTS